MEILEYECQFVFTLLDEFYIFYETTYQYDNITVKQEGRDVIQK